MINNKTISARRNTGADLARIIAMFLVVTGHVIGHCGIMGATEKGSATYFVLSFIGALTVPAANIYALVSGFVLYDKRYKYFRLFSLYLQVVCYDFAAKVIYNIYTHKGVGVKDFIISLLPIPYGNYWYFSAYLGLAILIPLLNAAVKRTELSNIKKAAVIFVPVLTVIALIDDGLPLSLVNGYSAFWLCCLYIIGALIKKYKTYEFFSKKVLALVAFIAPCTAFVCDYIIKRFAVLSGKKYIVHTFFLNNNSIFITVAAVAALMLLVKLRFKNEKAKRFTAFFSSLTFGIYILQLNRLSWSVSSGCLGRFGTLNPVLAVLLVIAVSIAAFVALSLTEAGLRTLVKLLRIDTAERFIFSGAVRAINKLFKKLKPKRKN